MYLAEAARFNVSRKPSYYLIERVTKRRTNPPSHEESRFRRAGFAGSRRATPAGRRPWNAPTPAGSRWDSPSCCRGWFCSRVSGSCSSSSGRSPSRRWALCSFASACPIALYGALQAYYILHDDVTPPEGHLVSPGEAPALTVAPGKPAPGLAVPIVRPGAHHAQLERIGARACPVWDFWAGRARSSRSAFRWRRPCRRKSSKRFWRMNLCTFPGDMAGAAAGSIGSTARGAICSSACSGRPEIASRGCLARRSGGSWIGTGRGCMRGRLFSRVPTSCRPTAMPHASREPPQWPAALWRLEGLNPVALRALLARGACPRRGVAGAAKRYCKPPDGSNPYSAGARRRCTLDRSVA